MGGDVPARSRPRVAGDAGEGAPQRRNGRRQRSSRGSSRAPTRTSVTRSSQSQPPSTYVSASARLPRGRALQKRPSCRRTVAEAARRRAEGARRAVPATSTRPSRRRSNRAVERNGANIGRAALDGTTGGPQLDRVAPTASQEARTLGPQQAEVDPPVRGGRRRGTRRRSPHSPARSPSTQGKELVREGDFSYEFMAIEDGEAEVTRGGDHLRDARPGRLLRRDGPAREDAAQRHGHGEDADARW